MNSILISGNPESEEKTEETPGGLRRGRFRILIKGKTGKTTKVECVEKGTFADVVKKAVNEHLPILVNGKVDFQEVGAAPHTDVQLVIEADWIEVMGVTVNKETNRPQTENKAVTAGSDTGCQNRNPCLASARTVDTSCG